MFENAIFIGKLTNHLSVILNFSLQSFLFVSKSLNQSLFVEIFDGFQKIF